MRRAHSAHDVRDQAHQEGHRDNDGKRPGSERGTSPNPHPTYYRTPPHRACGKAMLEPVAVRQFSRRRQQALMILAPEELTTHLDQRVIGIDNHHASRTLHLSHFDHLPTGSTAAGLNRDYPPPRTSSPTVWTTGVASRDRRRQPSLSRPRRSMTLTACGPARTHRPTLLKHSHPTLEE